jgi:hypothetical protein
MEFSDRVALSDILPLTSNASLNTSGSNASASAGANNNGGSSSQGAQQANMGVPLNASGNLVGAQPFSYVNVTDLNRQLSQAGLVTVMTVFMPDGTTITSFNISNTTGKAGNKGKRMHFNACQRLVACSPAYVTLQRGNRWQLLLMLGPAQPSTAVVSMPAHNPSALCTEYWN